MIARINVSNDMAPKDTFRYPRTATTMRRRKALQCVGVGIGGILTGCLSSKPLPVDLSAANWTEQPRSVSVEVSPVDGSGDPTGDPVYTHQFDLARVEAPNDYVVRENAFKGQRVQVRAQLDSGLAETYIFEPSCARNDEYDESVGITIKSPRSETKITFDQTECG
jgi:hypothetical protein